jgi:hypothetical protein
MVQAHTEMLVWATCSEVVHGAHMNDRTHNKLHELHAMQPCQASNAYSMKLGSTRDGKLTVVDCMVVRCTMLSAVASEWVQCTPSGVQLDT